MARRRKVSSAELRRDYIHAHTLALAALAVLARVAQKPRPRLEGKAEEARDPRLVAIQ